MGRKWPVGLIPGGIMPADHQLVVFADLDRQEEAAEDDGVPEEQQASLPIPLLDGREGQHHGDRRADQDEGVERGQVDGEGVGQLVVGLGPVVGDQRLDRGDGPLSLELSGQVFRLALGQVIHDRHFLGFLDDLVNFLLLEFRRSGLDQLWTSSGLDPADSRTTP